MQPAAQLARFSPRRAQAASPWARQLPVLVQFLPAQIGSERAQVYLPPAQRQRELLLPESPQVLAQMFPPQLEPPSVRVRAFQPRAQHQPELLQLLPHSPLPPRVQLPPVQLPAPPPLLPQARAR